MLLIICSTANLSTLSVPTIFICTTLLNASKGKGPFLLIILPGLGTPAQLTATFIFPKVSMVFLIACLISSSLVTSAFINITLAPKPAASFSPLAESISTMVTLAPFLTNSMTVASPNPDTPPVTNATTSLLFISPPFFPRNISITNYLSVWLCDRYNTP